MQGEPVDWAGAVRHLPAALFPGRGPGLRSLCLLGSPSPRRCQALRRHRGRGAACEAAGRAGGKQCRARAGEALPSPRRDRRGPGQPLVPASGGSGARRAPVLLPWAAARMHPAPTGAIVWGGGIGLISLYPAVKPTRLHLRFVCPRLRRGGCPEVAIWAAGVGVCAVEEPRVVAR